MENGSGVTSYKIECRGISKSYENAGRELQVLDGIDLAVQENEFVVILGPGQSGKTTLLRIIAGLESPTIGVSLLDGREISGPGPDRGLVFQKYTLFPWKTVIENVEMGPKLQGMPKKERRKIASFYIDLVGLSGFENAFPHQLSGGMKQRVSIARAYSNNPDVLLLDEPFGQLDAQTRYYMEQEIERIWQIAKKTVLFVTNNVEEAIFLGDRIVTLEGKLPGRMKTIYAVNLPRPRSYTELSFLELRQTITDDTELIL